MSLLKCVRIGLLAVIPAAAAACGNPTGPAPQPTSAFAQRAPEARVNLATAERSGYVLASGRGGGGGQHRQ
jgi:hypothetical protein